MIRGKYAPLFRHLSALDRAVWAATFEEVEAVLGFALPRSARKHQAWWANEEDGSHSHVRAWQMAGWRTSAVDLASTVLVRARLPRCRPRCWLVGARGAGGDHQAVESPPKICVC